MSGQVVIVKSRFGKVIIREEAYEEDNVKGLMVRVEPKEGVSVDKTKDIKGETFYMYRGV